MEKSDGEFLCPKEGCEYKSSEQGVKIHFGRSHDGSISGVNVECDYCAEVINKPEYKLDRSENLFCSKRCYADWRDENISGEDAGGWQGGISTKTFTCANCGRKSTAQRQRVEDFDMNFCDRDCMGEYYSEGYTPSGKNHKWFGKDRSGENNPLYGVVGENHPAWKGGHDGSWRRKGNKWRKLAQEIYQRDDYKCQRCGGVGELHAHHITPVSEGGAKYNKRNLVTLCMNCHNYVHSNAYNGKLLNSGD